MIWRAARTSRSRRASTERSVAFCIMLPSVKTSSCKNCSDCSKLWRGIISSAKPSRDVILGPLVARVGENLLGWSHLNQFAHAFLTRQHIGGPVGDAGGLLHVVGHDDDRVLIAQALHQVFDL